jgi:hypothetical protein
MSLPPLFRFIILAFSFTNLSISASLAAATHKGNGFARIIGADTNTARETALKSALFDASTKYKTNIFGITSTSRGTIRRDDTLLYSSAKLVKYDVVDEKKDKHFIRISVLATFSEAFRKVKCAAARPPNAVKIHYPSFTFRNFTKDEEFYIEDNVRSAFQIFRKSISKRIIMPSLAIQFSGAPSRPSSGRGVYEEYLYGFSNSRDNNWNNIYPSFEFDKVDKTFYSNINLKYNVRYQGELFGSNMTSSGSVDFTQNINSPNRVANVFTNSALETRELKIPFDQILNLEQLRRPQPRRCRPLTAHLENSKGLYFVRLGAANGITDNDLGWLETENGLGEILLIERIEKNRTVFKDIVRNKIKITGNPIVKMVRYE